MAKLIGNEPNQVPTNGDLGTMAYQDFDVFYEQGTFDARIVVNGVDTTDAPINDCTYVKVGDLVFIRASMRAEATAGNETGAVTISGNLPFAPRRAAIFSINGSRALDIPAGTHVTTTNGGTQFYLHTFNDDIDYNLSTNNVTTADPRTIKYIEFSGCYSVS